MITHPDIVNPNTSGQGHSPKAALHPLASIVADYGYTYSHTTPIVLLGGAVELHHTFKHGDHNVSLRGGTIDRPWDTSTSTASGRHWVGRGAAELMAHLASKARRYGLK